MQGEEGSSASSSTAKPQLPITDYPGTSSSLLLGCLSDTSAHTSVHEPEFYCLLLRQCLPFGRMHRSEERTWLAGEDGGGLLVSYGLRSSKGSERIAYL